MINPKKILSAGLALIAYPFIISAIKGKFKKYGGFAWTSV